MAVSNYLEGLIVRLVSGLAGVPADRLDPIRQYLLANQRADGGFAGREGESDLYYTGFALRALACLNTFTPEVRDGAAGFVRQRLDQPASIIDFVSLLYATRLIQVAGGPDVLAERDPNWPERVASALAGYRSPDGGYAKKAGAAMGSTYHTFLAALAHEMIRRPLPEPERIVTFLKSRQRADGGFVELMVMKRSGANPTAAAVTLLRILGGNGATAQSELARSAIDCLVSLQSEEGGFCANQSMPVADLLSTFTALLTLHELGAADRVDGRAALAFVNSLAVLAGGYRGGVWDDQSDVEYTFYGLGCLALLHGSMRAS